jgi:hypothetical protein
MASSLGYSSWVSENKKRPATYNKPQKTQNIQTTDETPSILDVNDLEIKTNYPESFADSQKKSEENKMQIHDLLDKMNEENFQEMSSIDKIPQFEPIEPPKLINKKEDITEQKDFIVNTGNSFFYPPVVEPSSYKQAYSSNLNFYPQKLNYNEQSFDGTNIGSGAVSNEKLLEKLNHMIYLLEEQQHEKTQNIWEEFILYCFLGIFIIFVIDSFSRSHFMGNYSGKIKRYSR